MTGQTPNTKPRTPSSLWLVLVWLIPLAFGACMPYVFTHESTVRRIIWMLMLVGSIIFAAALTRLHLLLKRSRDQ